MDTLQRHITGLLSANIEERNSAEAAFNQMWLEQHPKEILPLLCQSLDAQFPIAYRSLAAILFRRLAFKHFTASDKSFSGLLWNNMSNEQKSSCQNTLLFALKNEKEEVVKKKIGDSVAELAKTLIFMKIQWPELLTALQTGLSCGQPEEIVSSLRIITSIPDIFDKKNALPLFQLLLNNLNPNYPSSLLAVAIECIVSVYSSAPKKSIKGLMVEAVHHIWNLLKKFSLSEAENEYNEALCSLISLAECAPSVFKGQLVETIVRDSTCFVADDSKQDYEEIKHTFVELIVTLLEKLPEIGKKLTILPDFILVLFKLLADVPDDDEWADQLDNEPFDDDNENYAVAEQALDRVSCSLGGDAMAGIFMNVIPSMLAQSDWKQRHAGLMAIAYISEGCREQFENNLAAVLHIVVSKCNDGHPRVRYAAAHCLGQMCTDFSGTLPIQFHEIFFKNLLPLIQDGTNGRVQCHATAALINFCREINDPASVKTCLLPYLSTVMPLLFNCLSSPRQDVQEQAASTVASIANAVGGEGGHFEPYYGALMPPLLVLLKSLNNEHKQYRAKVVEAVSMLASAVSKSCLSPHIQQIIDAFIALQDSELDPDDPVADYLLSAWIRLCAVLGSDFAPLLSKVLPPLVAKASIEPDIAFVDDEEVNSEEFSNGWDFVHVKGKRIGINIALLDEKADAIESIERYAAILGPVFSSYVDQMLELILPLVKFDWHERVRCAAASSIAALFSSISQSSQGQNACNSYWTTKVAPILLEELHRHTDPELLIAPLSAIHGCLEIVLKDNYGSTSLLPSNLSPEIARILGLLHTQFHTGNKNSQGANLSESTGNQEEDDFEDEDDDADGESLLEDYEYLLTEFSRLIHLFLKYGLLQGGNMLSELTPFYAGLLMKHNPCCSLSVRHDAMCYYDDLIEYNKQDPSLVLPMLPVYASYLGDKDPDILQATAYGIGMMASSNPAFQSFCCQAVQPLLHLLQEHRNGNSIVKQSFQLALENILSAVAKIYTVYGSSLDMNHLASAFVAGLPASSDATELSTIYTFFISFVMSAHSSVTSHLTALAQVAVQSCIELASMKPTPPKDVFDPLIAVTKSHLVSKITPDQQRYLFQSLSEVDRQIAVRLQLTAN